MSPMDYYLWGAVKDKCYADKPETIDALKGNIREAIGEIQLHTIENVLRNWIDCIGYCMASISSRKDCTFKKNKKQKFQKIFSRFFLSILHKKRYLADPRQ